MSENREKYLQYENKLRVRVCGICLENDKLLLTRHVISHENDIWIPPGGGLEFGENVIDGLKREFLEETGLIIKVGKFLCLNEYIENKLHAIELFFITDIVGGDLLTGMDPEHSVENQMIKNVKFLSFEEIQNLPDQQLHNILHDVKKASDLLQKSGYSHFFGFHSK